MDLAIKCFVCHVKTDDWRNGLRGLTSQHSSTLVTDFIRTILGDFDLKRSVDDETNCICSDCLNRFEEYDWACTMAKQYEKELYDLLVKTDGLIGVSPVADAAPNTDAKTKLAKTFADPLTELNDFPIEPSIRTDELEVAGGVTDGGDDADGDLLKVMVEPLTIMTIPKDKPSDDELADNDEMELPYNEDLDSGAVENQKDDPDFHCKVEDDDGSSFIDNEDDDYVPQKRQAKRKKAKAAPIGKTEDGAEPVPKKRGRKPKIRDEQTERKPRKKREKKTHECKECEKVFDKMVDYVAHRKWHRELLIPEFRCSKCFYISENQEAFEAHAKLHEDKPPLQCVFCNLTFTFKGTLTKHTRIHSNQRNYQCSMCGKQFLRSISLNTHMKYHLNMKTKQCPHCPMVFVETKNLTRHLKTHTLEKPYSCSICGRRFAYSYNVRPHEKTHTDRNVYRKFKCTVTDCKSAFDSKAKLNTHLQKSHAMTSLIYENTNNPTRLGL